MGSTKVLPIFLFLVEQITQTSDRPAMIACDRLGMEQTAQHTFLTHSATARNSGLMASSWSIPIGRMAFSE